MRHRHKLSQQRLDSMFEFHPRFPVTEDKDQQWSSGSSFRRLGGTVVMRIFTVASDELISKPVSLVSMVKTGRGTESTDSHFHHDITVQGGAQVGFKCSRSPE